MRLRGCPTQRIAHAQACWFTCWAVLFIGVLTAASTLSAPAQDMSTEQEAKTRFSKEELRARLQSRERVRNAIIQGYDLIAILCERTFDSTVGIAIVNSVIEGGLDFTILPATALEQVEWPKLWSDEHRENREKWIARYRSYEREKLHAVANPIIINASTILPSASSLAVNAESTLFHQMTFHRTTFSGTVLFGHATFSGTASFTGVHFANLASFKDTRFLPTPHLRACSV